MRILILTQYYDPEPVPIPGQIARGLKKRGHDVRVLTSAPSYPSGRVYAGYRNKKSITLDKGIPVHRVRSVTSHTQSARGRFGSYAGFAISAAAERSLISGADVVYVYATQMTASFPAHWWLRYGGSPFVLHVQDLWPESVTGSMMVPKIGQKILPGIMNPWLQRAYARSAGIVAIAPTMAEILAQRSSTPNKVHMLLNWSVENGETVSARKGRVSNSGLNLLYAGNVGELQGLDVVVDALAMTTTPEVRLRVVGAGSNLRVIKKRASTLIRRHRIEFYDPVPRDQLSPHLAWADFQVIPLRDLDIFRGTIPSKAQGSLREGIPVITNVPGDLARMVAEHGLGLVAHPGSTNSLAREMDEASLISDEEYSEMSRKSLDFYAKSMSEESALDRLESILTEAAIDIRN